MCGSGKERGFSMQGTAGTIKGDADVSNGFADDSLDINSSVTAVLVYQLCWCGGSDTRSHQSGDCRWS
ncbi:hypothetical protein GCM10025858_25110 [Alicyclobacillus sacchari]|nr:hypothetical protein GCM10025858_25110 [Alicyclobacillus sacchari]